MGQTYFEIQVSPHDDHNVPFASFLTQSDPQALQSLVLLLLCSGRVHGMLAVSGVA